ncbi:MAG: hypothetical protein OEZ39_08875 [Gammaproteobacteria bacterium]|nr:hypothetical protein [Gammaproteobacteria bacterium]MDH5651977.1 hypothetical protein [Gammaproteobacteria bacterium]
MKKKPEINSADFSQQAISRAVKREMLESPGVLYPAAGGALGLLAGALLLPTWWMFGIGLGGLLLGSGFFAANYNLRRETYANRYVQKLFEKMEAQRKERTAKLKESLQKVGSAEGLSQYQRINNKFENLRGMLTEKLNQGELTHTRYLAIAEQVYLGVLDNLYDLTNALRSVGSIEVNHVNQRLKQIEKSGKLTKELDSEREALLQRLALKQAQENKVQQYLAQNEKAMTQLDMTIAAISDMRTEDDRAELDIETAMNRLQDLAKRARHYSQN